MLKHFIHTATATGMVTISTVQLKTATKLVQAGAKLAISASHLRDKAEDLHASTHPTTV